MGISFLNICAISTGAALGAIGRWLLSLLLNPLFASIPPGTLAANWLGSFLMGLAASLFTFWSLPQELKLGVTTGFLGAFTTFSTFSAEMSQLLLQKRFGMLTMGIGLHVIGSLLLFMAGLMLGNYLFGQR